jgi:hypothetical protein
LDGGSGARLALRVLDVNYIHPVTAGANSRDSHREKLVPNRGSFQVAKRPEFGRLSRAQLGVEPHS